MVPPGCTTPRSLAAPACGAIIATMCLISVALGASARLPVVIAANRDERHARASAAAGWWPDAPRVLGGRDLVAGGTWLAIDRAGRIGAVTNRFASPRTPAPRSRGALVTEFLAGTSTAEQFAAHAEAEGERFGPFNLVLVDAAGALVVSNCGERLDLTNGIRSFGNTALEDDWPKLGAATAGVERALGEADPVAALFDVLATRRAAPAERGPDRENLFIVGAEFGTRSSTVVIVDAGGHATFVERRFDAAARPLGERRFEFDIEAGAQSS